jgi:hypothetical protein
MKPKEFDKAGLPEGMRPAYGLGKPRISTDTPRPKATAVPKAAKTSKAAKSAKRSY